MPFDMTKTTGSLKHAKPEAGGNSNNLPVIGVVKDNIDPTCAGRIRVSLVNGTGSTDPNDSGGWVTVQQLSTFFGSVGGTAGKGSDDHGTYKSNPSSYGVWHAPPDIGTKVVCIFINGDPNYGFYIGCIPEPEKLQMVPAIGASDKVTLNSGEASNYGGATRLPVTNLNTNNKDKADSADFLNTARPVHSYTASIMNQQGIIRDPVRGPISSSASREPASRVGWGVSTPGRPIYTGGFDDTTLPENLDQSKSEQLQVIARRGGHSIVMDDGDIIGRDQLIRIRTSLGHQILMSDDGQTLMILHSNGQSYIELGKEGTVDIFSTNSFNVRTQGDINFHADQNINIHAAENLNIQAKNIQTNSEESTKSRAGTDYNINALSNYTVKAGSAAAIAAGGEASMVAGGPAFVNGSKVNLNSGSPGTSPADVPSITLIAQTDTLFDEQVGWAAAPGKLLTIASRAPAHAPWVNAGQGISIKTSPNASDNLPPSPSVAVQQTNQLGAATGATPPAVATVASTPPTPPVSSSVNAGTTNAILGATATAASSGVAAPAVNKGAAIINASENPASGGNNATIVAGAYGQTAEQLVNAGVLKPGSDKLVNALASEGFTIIQAVADELFTGKEGADSIKAFATNTSPQTTAVVTTLQKAQTLLTASGVISGKEDSTQTSGLITAAATSGVDKIINVVKTAASIKNSDTSQFNEVAESVSGGLIEPSPGKINQFQSAEKALGTASDLIKAIGTGNESAKLADSLSGLKGMVNAINALSKDKKPLTFSSLTDSVNGSAAEAFLTIKKMFPKLVANKPQNLSKIVKESAKETATTAASSPVNQTEKLTAGDALKKIKSGVEVVENTISVITGEYSSSLLNTQFSDSGLSAPNNGSDIKKLINTASNAIDTFNSVSKAVDIISGLAGANQAVKSDGKKGLSDAAKAVQSGGTAAQAAAVASGVTNLPGGMQTVSSVVDNSKTKVNVPGASKLTSLLKNAQTAKDTNTQTLGKLTDVTKSISTGVNQLTNTGVLPEDASVILNKISNAADKLGGLTSLATEDMDTGNASSLLTSLSALGGGSPSPVKVAEVGFNTFSRESITTQLINNLGDLGIPVPNLLGEIKPETIGTLDAKIEELKKIRDDLKVKKEEFKAKRNAAKNAYNEAKGKLPAGDPSLVALKEAYDNSVAEYNFYNLKYDSASIEVTSSQFQNQFGVDVNASAKNTLTLIKGIV